MASVPRQEPRNFMPHRVHLYQPALRNCQYLILICFLLWRISASLPRLTLLSQHRPMSIPKPTVTHTQPQHTGHVGRRKVACFASRLTSKDANANHCSPTSFYMHSRWELTKMDTQETLDHPDGLKQKRCRHGTIHDCEVPLIWSCEPEVVLENANEVS